MRGMQTDEKRNLCSQSSNQLASCRSYVPLTGPTALSLEGGRDGDRRSG